MFSMRAVRHSCLSRRSEIRIELQGVTGMAWQSLGLDMLQHTRQSLREGAYAMTYASSNWLGRKPADASMLSEKDIRTGCACECTACILSLRADLGRKIYRVPEQVVTVEALETQQVVISDVNEVVGWHCWTHLDPLPSWQGHPQAALLAILCGRCSHHSFIVALQLAGAAGESIVMAALCAARSHIAAKKK